MRYAIGRADVHALVVDSAKRELVSTEAASLPSSRGSHSAPYPLAFEHTSGGWGSWLARTAPDGASDRSRPAPLHHEPQRRHPVDRGPVSAPRCAGSGSWPSCAPPSMDVLLVLDTRPTCARRRVACVTGAPTMTNGGGPRHRPGCRHRLRVMDDLTGRPDDRDRAWEPTAHEPPSPGVAPPPGRLSRLGVPVAVITLMVATALAAIAFVGSRPARCPPPPPRSRRDPTGGPRQDGRHPHLDPARAGDAGRPRSGPVLGGSHHVGSDGGPARARPRMGGERRRRG